jgi:hypothetical protein
LEGWSGDMLTVIMKHQLARIFQPHPEVHLPDVAVLISVTLSALT